jgi:hypothetical protein
MEWNNVAHLRHKLWTLLQNALARTERTGTFETMGERKEESSAARTVSRTEFLNDAGRVLDRARREGPIVVTDDRGQPRMAIHSPTDKLPVNID